MGLESYLFYVEFYEALSETELDELLISTGLTRVSKSGEKPADFREYYYEVVSDRGITEAHSLWCPGEEKIQKFSLRFSIINPAEVIEQTFELLARLNDSKSIKLKDTEIYNHVYRRLRQKGKVNDHFKGLTKEEDLLIQGSSYINIDANEFRKNEMSIKKRAVLIKEQGDKQIVRGGTETMEHINKKGNFDKFMDWIKNEL